MAVTRCEYCHEYINASEYRAHVAQHTQRLADGQQVDYMTLPESERARGSLRGVPQVYVHRRCGVKTGMPEEIVRSYLNNPYLYGSDRTFCGGCGKHVRMRECQWTETGENVQTYMNRLRAAKRHMKPSGWTLSRIMLWLGMGGRD